FVRHARSPIIACNPSSTPIAGPSCAAPVGSALIAPRAPMDFSISPELVALRDRTRASIRAEVIPLERDPRRTSHGPTDELRRELNARARAAGLLAPHVDHRLGGLGLGHVGRAIVFEEAGYSMLGPVALHCAAPDEGNMHLMSLVATPP